MIQTWILRVFLALLSHTDHARIMAMCVGFGKNKIMLFFLRAVSAAVFLQKKAEEDVLL